MATSCPPVNDAANDEALIASVVDDVVNEGYTSLHPLLRNPASRDWLCVNNNKINAGQLVFPLFISDKDVDTPIKGFYPNKQWSWRLKNYVSYLKELVPYGLKAVMLFGVINDELKDNDGGVGSVRENPVVQALRELRSGEH